LTARICETRTTKSNSFAAREKDTRNTKRRKRSGDPVPVPVDLYGSSKDRLIQDSL
jgi:hypothetical protein